MYEAHQALAKKRKSPKEKTTIKSHTENTENHPQKCHEVAWITPKRPFEADRDE